MQHTQTTSLDLSGLMPQTRAGKIALVIGLLALCAVSGLWNLVAADPPQNRNET
jgi:hypothetical protein